MNNTQLATLAGGCFWCTEAIFQRLKGVSKVTPGYCGGKTSSPNYDEVSAGESGHAEAVQVEFDPAVLPYPELLRIFFHLHDPTTLNRQGPDTGTQYRSAIFFHDGEQAKVARQVMEEVQPDFREPIVTEIVPYDAFYPAEGYHHRYFEKHAQAPYCQLVVEPKVQKLLEKYGDRVKSEYRKA